MSRREREEPDLPPMPVIGENRPDVEDTTVEELRRQQDEAQAQLRRRQADLDRIERRLEQRHGRSTVQRELDLQQEQRARRSRGGLRSSVAGFWGALAAIGLLVAGTITAGTDPDLEGWEEIARTDAARVVWLGVAVAADQAWALTEAGDTATPRDGGPADPVAQAQEASGLAGDYADQQQVFSATADGLGAAPGSARAASAWSTVHATALGVVDPGQVSDEFHEHVRQGSVPMVLVTLGALAVLAVLGLALRLRAWWQAGALALALALAGLTVFRVDGEAPGAYWEDAREHWAAQQELTAIVDELHTDLSQHLDSDPGADGAAAQDRAEEGVRLAEEGRSRFDATAAHVQEERELMLERLETSVGPSAGTAATGLLGAALVGAALALPARGKTS